MSRVAVWKFSGGYTSFGDSTELLSHVGRTSNAQLTLPNSFGVDIRASDRLEFELSRLHQEQFG